MRWISIATISTYSDKDMRQYVREQPTDYNQQSQQQDQIYPKSNAPLGLHFLDPFSNVSFVQATSNRVS